MELYVCEIDNYSTKFLEFFTLKIVLYLNRCIVKSCNGLCRIRIFIKAYGLNETLYSICVGWPSISLIISVEFSTKIIRYLFMCKMLNFAPSFSFFLPLQLQHVVLTIPSFLPFF